MDTNGYSTWLEISLDAVQNSVNRLQQITSCEVMAVVKANGYGHGAIQITQAMVKAGSNWCSVGRLEDALALRQAGLDCEILVMGYTIPLGYADGFKGVNHQQVLLYGQRADVVGRVCMDQCAVQLDEIPQARIGDEVVLLGQQSKERIGAEELGMRWGTVNYEVVCGLANRLPRLYF